MVDKKEIEDKKTFTRYIINKIMDIDSKNFKEKIAKKMGIDMKELNDKFIDFDTRIIRDLDESGEIFSISHTFGLIKKDKK